MDTVKPEKQYVRTVTSGWRVTLPAPIRKNKGWGRGTTLCAEASRNWLSLSVPHNTSAGIDGICAETDCQICYVGSGGKIVIPVEVREKTGWVIGERLSVKEQGLEVILSTCCQKHRCHSCGSVSDVTEVIDNLFLCKDCWNKYLQKGHR